MHLSIGILAALALPSLAFSQNQFTVEEAVRQAMANNPRALAIANQIASAEANIRSASSIANPLILFTPAITKGGSDEEVLVQLPLEMNGARAARTGIARAELQQTRSELLTELRQIIFQTKTAYYSLSRARQEKTLAQSSVEFFKTLDESTRKQVEIGTRAQIDQISTGIELTRAQQQLTLAEAEEGRVLAALNTLMGREPSSLVAGLVDPVTAPTPIDEQLLEGRALESRGELLGGKARAKRLGAELGLVRAEGRPDLVPQYRVADVTRGDDNSSGLGVGISLPLIDFGSRRSKSDALQKAIKAQDLRVEAIRNEIRQEVCQAILRLRAADKVVEQYEKGILQQAKQLLEASRVGYQAGQTSIVALFESQRTYRAVISEYNAAVLNQANARAELELVTGAVPLSTLPNAKEARP